jgi:hypothetical protein
MIDETESADDALEAYRRLMATYGYALSTGDPMAQTVFAEATALWEQLRALDRDEQLDPDRHLVLAISYAIQANDPVEAKRIYDAMSESSRSTADELEAMRPGSTKIWLAGP